MSAVAKLTTQVAVEAISIEHAKRIASVLTGHPIELVSDVTLTRHPRPATTCKTDDFPVKGTRKWKTVYHIYTYATKIPVGRNKYQYTHLEFVMSGGEQKVEAVKKAKELAIKHQLPMTVQIAKELEDSTPNVADVEPKTATGKYQVYFNA